MSQQVAPSPRRGRARAELPPARPGEAAPHVEPRASAACADQPRPLTVCIPAVEADAALRDRLRSHLHPLEKAGLLDIHAGAGVADADIVLPIVSIDFLNSAGSAGDDMENALARHRQRRNRVIPIIARPCLWDATHFGGLAALPPHARAISSSPSEEETLVDVVRGVRAIAEQMGHRSPAG